MAEVADQLLSVEDLLTLMTRFMTTRVGLAPSEAARLLVEFREMYEREARDGRVEKKAE